MCFKLNPQGIKCNKMYVAGLKLDLCMSPFMLSQLFPFYDHFIICLQCY